LKDIQYDVRKISGKSNEAGFRNYVDEIRKKLGLAGAHNVSIPLGRQVGIVIIK